MPKLNATDLFRLRLLPFFKFLPIIIFFFFFPRLTVAQYPLVLELPSSPNPVGSGARALGMGGAFIAVADDATAASWNPGGLIQLETPEMSFVLSGTILSEDIEFQGHPEASGKQSIDYGHLNYLSAAYPFELADHNMIVSLNYQHLYDFHRSWDWVYEYSQPSIYTKPAEFKYEQKGELYALGLAFSSEITNRFSAGITINYWGDFLYKNGWKQNYEHHTKSSVGGIPITYDSYQEEEYEFEGWNAVIGFLWRIWGNMTIGGVLKTPFTADIEHTVSKRDVTYHATLGRTDYFSSVTSEKELHMPMSYGLGISYRFSDAFTLSFDAYRTHWQDFYLEDEKGNKASPISGRDLALPDVDPTTWFRMGAEYLFIGSNFIVPLRTGIFYDPSPAEEKPDDYYGVAAGTGFAWKRFVFDIAYQFRFGNNVGGSEWREGHLPMDVKEHKLYCSLITHF
jgi:long-subunit fatty acid transport protein